MLNQAYRAVVQLSDNTPRTMKSIGELRSSPLYLSIELQIQKFRDKLISTINNPMPKQYDHNVDIKSTQATDAVKSVGKFAVDTWNMGSLVLIIIIIGAVGINAFKHLSMHSKTSGGAIHLDPWKFKSESAQNSQRAISRFIDKYVRMTGRITGLYGSSFTIESYGNKIDCNFPNWYFVKQWYNRDFVNNYNMGQTINAKGILTGANVTSDPSRFRLTHCMPYQ